MARIRGETGRGDDFQNGMGRNVSVCNLASKAYLT